MDPRKILGVSPNATLAEIQRAYRDKVKKHHPDLGGDVWAFQQVSDAYESLTRHLDGSVAPPKTKPPSQPTNHPEQYNAEQANTPKGSPSNAATPDSFQESNARRKPGSEPQSSHTDSAPKSEYKPDWRKVLVGELPLQNETTFFVFVNALDIFMTFILLYSGGIEANPVARWFMQLWGFRGMIFFKLSVVAFVCVLAQIVATMKIQSARLLLNAGSLLVGCVVIYSITLYFRHFF